MTQKYQVKVSMKQAAIVETGIVLKQGDFGMQIEIEVLDFDATGTTPQIVFRKAMGAVESTTITVSSNKYTYTFKGTELDTPGKVFCDLKLKNSTTQRISTASFMFKVVADTMDGLEEESSSYSDTIAQILEEYGSEVHAVNSNIAPTYSASSTYNVGDYVIYNDSLYRCITKITSGEAWTAAHWTSAAMGTETVNLNKAFSEETKLLDDSIAQLFDDTNTYDNALSLTFAYGFIDTNGSTVNANNSGLYGSKTSLYCGTYISAKKGSKIIVQPGYEIRVALYTGTSYTTLIRLSNPTPKSENFYVPQDCYVRVTLVRSDHAVMETSEASNVAVYLCTDSVKDQVSSLDTKFTSITNDLSNKCEILDGELNDYSQINTTFEFGFIDTDGQRITSNDSGLYGSKTSLANGQYIYVNKGSKIDVASGYKIRVAMYSGTSYGSLIGNSNPTPLAEDYYIPQDCYVRVTLARVDQAQMETSEASNVVIYNCKNELVDLKAEVSNITDGDGLMESTNMFNKATAQSGYLNGGVVTESSSFVYSDYIFVDRTKTYAFRGIGKANGIFIQIELYDGNKTFIADLDTNAVELITSGTNYPFKINFANMSYNLAYIRLNILYSNLDTYMFVEGDTYPGTYTAYNLHLKSEDLDDYIGDKIEEALEPINEDIAEIQNEIDSPVTVTSALAAILADVIDYNRENKFINIAFFTDTHSNLEDAADSIYTMQAIETTKMMDLAIHGGDLITTYGMDFGQYIYTMLTNMNKYKKYGNMLFVKGNHDNNHNDTVGDENENASKYQYHMLMQNNIDYFGAVVNASDPYGCYFYIDKELEKVRIIVLDSFSIFGDSTTVSFGTTQLNWLYNTALDVEDGWTVIVFSHMFSTSQTDCLNILKAFANRGSTYGGYTFNNSITTHLVGVIHGHEHYDSSTTSDNVNIVGVTRGYGESNEETKEAVDIFTIDTVAKKLYETRIGRGVSRTFSFI